MQLYDRLSHLRTVSEIGRMSSCALTKFLCASGHGDSSTALLVGTVKGFTENEDTMVIEIGLATAFNWAS